MIFGDRGEYWYLLLPFAFSVLLAMLRRQNPKRSYLTFAAMLPMFLLPYLHYFSGSSTRDWVIGIGCIYVLPFALLFFVSRISIFPRFPYLIPLFCMAAFVLGFIVGVNAAGILGMSVS
jgi:hypothetical protein